MEQKCSINSLQSSMCKIHPQFPLDLIHIHSHQSQKDHLVCLCCVRENDISMRQIVTIKEMIDYQNGSEYSRNSMAAFTKDKQIQNIILQFNSDSDEMVLQIDEYFNNLLDKVQHAISIAKSKAKLKVSNFISLIVQFETALKQIIKSELITQHIYSNQQQQQSQLFKEQLHDMICQALDGVDKNELMLKEYAESYKQMKDSFNPTKHELQIQQLLYEVENIQLFNQINLNILSSLSFIPQSNYKNSTELLKVETSSNNNQNYISNEISNNSNKSSQNMLDNNCIIITNIDNSDVSKQGYFDYIFNPQLKYIIRLEIEQNSQNNPPSFYFGLITQKQLDQGCSVLSTGICYCEGGGEYGLHKRKTNNVLYSDRKTRNLRKFLEFRVALSDKKIEILNYPQYTHSIELEDKGRIILNEGYRFAINIQYFSDKVKIREILQVQSFDDKLNLYDSKQL